MLRDQADGLPIAAHAFTVAQAVEDWLTHGPANRDPATQKTNRHLCESHVMPLLGARSLRDLTAPEVDAWTDGAGVRGRLKSMVCVDLAPDCLMYSFNIGLRFTPVRAPSLVVEPGALP